MQRLRTLPREKATGDVASMISSHHVVVHLPMAAVEGGPWEEAAFSAKYFQQFTTL